MPKKEPSFNKEYLSEKLLAIKEKLGDAYGGPLMEELIIRMERTVAHFDFEVETTTGWLELVACNYRSDYDLTSHANKSKEKFEVMDNDEKVLPHVFEISMGIDRSLYTILESGLREDKENDRRLIESQ